MTGCSEISSNVSDDSSTVVYANTPPIMTTNPINNTVVDENDFKDLTSVIEIIEKIEGYQLSAIILENSEIIGELTFLPDNNSENISSARIFIDPEKTYTEEWSWEQVVNYLGVDFRPEYIPPDLYNHFDIYREDYVFDGDEQLWLVYFNNDGTMYIASFGLWYIVNLDIARFPFRSLTISVAKGEIPFSCATNLSEWEMSSNIRGIEVMVSHALMSYGHGKDSMPAGYYDIYIAEFLHNGLGYRIVSDNLKTEEFVHVLLSIIQ